jgi:hypothetical protein
MYRVSTPQGPVKDVDAIVADDTLIAGGPDPATAEDPVQIRQRFAAETALMAAGGNGAATVVVVPPRGWDSEGTRTAALMQGMTLPWITPIDLRQVASLTPLPAKPTNQKSTPTLPDGQLNQLKELSTTTETYRSMLADPNPVDEDLKRALLRLSSSSWAGYPDEALRFGTFERAAVTKKVSQVHLVNAAVDSGKRKEIKVNLSGSKGTFPLTVENELDVSVRVRIEVSSANRSDLRVGTVTTRVLAPRQKATYQINASAEQNGLIRANAQVVSAEGLPIGKSQELLIEAAQYGSVGWILVGAACALLFGTSAVRIYRRIRSERRNPTGDAAATDPLHPEPLLMPEHDDGVPGNGLAPGKGLTPVETGADESLKEGVGTKDG